MELIERAQASVVAAMYGEPFDAHQMPEAYAFAEKVAKAAIRAMLDGVDPVAWIICNHSRCEAMLSETPLPDRADELGWTETQLYTLDALKEAVKP